ncbi:hypothetical protein CSB92_2493 [Pseudomonas aeruginosa]|nr:hypothetical protein CSC30_3738 [Pseudomonas aeruginosa]AWF69583.1 hypothetical protein CSC27_6282 [Pseudomonas aeruginosa]AWZ84620.1 hypothetical protein CSC41_1516 [Pseudomonas aeruginosa]PRW17178.1 hypothetical protein CSB92_2493 [Pseudomonas aeruginosa]QJE75274.1 Uncharacterized protein PA52Ts1_0314 [Pseudomonas aeruginosa]
MEITSGAMGFAHVATGRVVGGLQRSDEKSMPCGHEKYS